ncbi:hypothetical protein DH2020_042544 [Rehmannia glutinosa]|uniref:Retrotransposon gag domain-containing protein n=1 Tax=Rehmannia glutinosa TaxID=99300 RepID=A0ABR0UM43_REHGL
MNAGHEALRTEMHQKFNTMQESIDKLTQLVTLSLHGKNPAESSAVTKAGLDVDILAEKSSTTNLPFHSPHLEEPHLTSKHIEIPMFTGDDPIGWLARAEQYFAIQRTREDLKVATTFISMEGPALHWLRWLQQQSPTLTWEQFKSELLEEFGGELSGPPIEQLAALRQMGSVNDYANEFRARVAQLPGLAPHVQLGLFLNGLKPENRVRLRPNDVVDLRTAMRVARSVEREIEFLSTGRVSGKNISVGIVKQGNSGHTRHPTFPPRTSGAQTTQKAARQYSHREYIDMRAKGLCFRCHQPYSPMHVCPNKSLRTLIAAEDEDEEIVRELVETNHDDNKNSQPDAAQFSLLDLPLTTINGICGQNKIKSDLF